MTDREIQEFIDKLGTYGSVLGLDLVRELLRRLGNPQDKCKVIHIAGTNGKGSVLAYVSTVLYKAGYRVGRYLSPVIHEYREKIQINEKNITKKALAEGMTLIRDAISEMERDGFSSPTLFEAETSLAFWYFAKKECDYVVLETGLGGREDATNVISAPLVCVLTPVSMDHMAILGKTLGEIARVKCGIIKPGAVVVSGIQENEVFAIVKETAEKNGCKLQVAKAPEKVSYGLEKQTFSYGPYKKVQITLGGIYQPENAALALEVITALRSLGVTISDVALAEGMKSTRWDGRFTLLRKKPIFIMDGAHNEAAAIRLRESLETVLCDKRKIFIIGVLKDKEYVKVLEHTADLAEHIITLMPPENPRALPAYELAKEAERYHSRVTTADSVEEAVEIASLLSGPECAIIAFGSLSYLGRLEQVVRKDRMPR